MKKQVRTKLISILLIVFILADLFSPYSILLNKSYAATTNELSVKPAIILERTSEIKTAIDGNDEEIRYFEVQLAMKGDDNPVDGGWIPYVTHIDLKYNTNKLALINQTYAEADPTSVITATKTLKNKYIYEGLSELTGAYGSGQMNLHELGEGVISLEFENGSGYGAIDYDNYMPFVKLNFKIKDPDIDLSKLTTDLITLFSSELTGEGNGDIGEGILIEYNNSYDDFEAGEETNILNSAEYFSYEGFIKSDDVKIIDGVEITTIPTKVEYIHDDVIKLDGGVITITYTNGTTETVNMAETTDFVLEKTEVEVGDTKVRGVFLGKYNLEYSIEVKDPVVKLNLVAPTKLEYNQGDTIDLNGGEITPITKSGVVLDTISLPDTRVIPSTTIADVTGEGFESNGFVNGMESGIQTITLTYEGVSVELDIMVQDTVDSISIKDEPKTVYRYGAEEEIDRSKGSILVKTTGGKTVGPVYFTNSSIEIEGYNFVSATRQEITVRYLGKEAKYYVTVEDPIESIKVTPLPKLVYDPEDALDLTGAYVYEERVSGKLVNGTPLTEDMISGYVNTKVGVQTLTVSYEGKTTTFDITVLDAVKTIEVTGMKTDYSYGASGLDISNAKVTPIMYSEERGTPVPVTSEMIVSTFEPNKLGNQDITIQYEGVTTVVTVNVADVVKSISVKTAPDKTRYSYGESLDISNGVITVEWMSGAESTEENLIPNMVKEADGSNFNSIVTFPDGQTTLKKNLTIHYGGETTTYEVTIVNEVIKVEMKTNPKTEYNVNDTLEVTGGVITVTRQNGQTEDIAMTDSRVEVTGLDTSVAIMNQNLTVTFTENEVSETTTYEIDVIDQVKEIKVISQPNKKEYGYEEALTLDGAQIEVTYGSGKQTINVTNNMITNYNNQQTGKQNLIVEYPIGSGIVSEVKIPITVVDKLVKIEMNSIAKPEYKLNENINNSETFTLTRQSGATEVKTIADLGVEITGFSSDTETIDRRITIKYTENYSESSVSAETYFDIKVIDRITKIEVITLPKTEYRYGELFSTTDGKVRLTKESGDASEVIDLSECLVTGYDETTIGNQVILVEYTRNGVYNSCKYTVNVSNYVSGITVAAPTKVDYAFGDALVLDGGSVTKIMADGTTETVELSDAGVTIKDKDTITEQIGTNLPVTVEYAGKTATFYINVQDEIKDVVLMGTIQTTYQIGDRFNANGAYYLVTTNAMPEGSRVEIKEDMYSGFNTETATEATGTRTITIVVAGRTFEYTYVVNDYIKGIELVGTPQTRYSYTSNPDAKLNIKGVLVKKIMASGDEVTAISLDSPGVTYTELIPNKLGAQTITVSYENFEAHFTIYVRDELVSIELDGNPKQNYIYGDEFAANNAKVKINYLSKSEKIDLTESMITDFRTSGEGALTNGTPRTATVSFTYGDSGDAPKTAITTFIYEVEDKVEDIVLIEPTTKAYYYGLAEELDLTGGTVQKIMKSGIVQAVVNLEEIRSNITGFISRPSELGTQTITVNYEGITKTFEIEVKDRLEGISIDGNPQTSYYWGDSINLNGAKLKIDRLKNDEEVIITPDMVDDFSTAQLTGDGEVKTATIVKVEDEIEKKVTFTYTVADYIKEIASVKKPSKATYYLYDEESEFDYSDGYLVITMASGTPQSDIILTDGRVAVTGFNTDTTGIKVINIEFTNEKGEKLPASYNIEVKDRLDDLKLVGTPKSSYKWGEALVLNGAKLEVTKISGITYVNITPEMVENFTTTQLTEEGTPRIARIPYSFDDRELEVTFTYTVEDYIKEVELNKPNKVQYYYGEELVLDDSYLAITMASGEEAANVALTDSRVAITGYDKEELGTQTVTVEYAGFTATFEVEVIDRLEEVNILGAPKTAYKFGEELDLNGAELEIVKLSGRTNIAITEDMISGFISNELTKENPRDVVISYTFDGVTKTDSFEYTVGDYISDVTLVKPYDLEYYLREELVLDGGKLEITMASGEPAADVKLTDARVSGYDKDTLGKQTITVEYAGFTRTFEVLVKDRLEEVNIVGAPKTTYKFGEELDLNGAKLEIVKLSGKTEVEITEDMISGFTSTQLTKENPREVVISHIFDGTIKTDSFEYIVEDYIVGATLIAPNKVEYDFGTELVLTDSYLIISMASGESAENVYLTDSRVTITGYDKEQLGQQTVKVEYAGFEQEFGVLVVDKVKEVRFDVDSIAKESYKYGEALDLSEATAEIENLSGKKIPVQIDNSMVSGYNPTKLGKQTVTITVAGAKKEIEVTVVDYVTGIELTAPEKVLYIVKEKLDLTGGSLKVTMASSAVETKILTESMVSGYVPTKLGPQTVTVTYEGFTKQFSVQVVDKLADVSIEALPEKLQYKYGEKLDLTGAKLRITNESDEYEIINITSDMVSGYDPKELGEQILTVIYQNDEGEEKTTTFAVVVEDYVKEILFTKPEKTKYKWGEELDLTGASFTEMLASGKVNKVVYVTPEMVTKFNNKTVGKQTLIATYGDTTGEFEVSVSDDILSMAINNRPNKVEYTKGEAINLVGGKITIIKDSGVYNIDITEEMVSGYDPNKVGTQILTVKYQGLEVELSVVVKEVEVIKPTRPSKRPTKKPTTIIEEVVEGLGNENISDEDTNANASENKDKENNNDVDKDVTLAEKEQSGNDTDGENASVVVKTVTISGLGIVALIALAFMINRKKNVKIYEEDEDELILVGKVSLDAEEKIIDISKYIENAPDKNIVLVLDKGIANKLDKQVLKIKLDTEELETTVEYEDGEFEIRIEK